MRSSINPMTHMKIKVGSKKVYHLITQITRIKKLVNPINPLNPMIK